MLDLQNSGLVYMDHLFFLCSSSFIKYIGSINEIYAKYFEVSVGYLHLISNLLIISRSVIVTKKEENKIIFSSYISIK